ncbi:MAG: phosphoribosyltransferase [Alphaproteobacteria bacterium]|nr:MAG: phosphoribosyltransferase [Alphaproteobacteria bacterium]
MHERFQDRIHAGRALAKALGAYAGRKDTLVLALPRGGVPLAHEIAGILALPMDVWLVRKLGVPGYEELAMGAIALGDTCYLNDGVIRELNVPLKLVRDVIASEQKELNRRNNLYRRGAPLPDLGSRTVIIVDDGLATGATMRAAIESLRAAKAARIVVAVPVGSASTCAALRDIADEVVCLRMPEPFYGVGQFYDDFSQTSDEEVLAILGQHPPATMEQKHAKK